MVSNHDKMKEKLQKKRKSFKVLCPCFFFKQKTQISKIHMSAVGPEWKEVL